MTLIVTRNGNQLSVLDTVSGRSRDIPISRCEYFEYPNDLCKLEAGDNSRRFEETYGNWLIEASIPSSTADWMAKMRLAATTPSYDPLAAARGEDGRVYLGLWKNGANYNPAAGEDIYNINVVGIPYQFDAAPATYYLVSSAAGDTQFVTLEMVDDNSEAVEVTVQLTGTTPVALTGTYIRVNRMMNVDTAFAGNVTLSVSSSPTPAVADQRAYIPVGQAIDQNAVFSTQTGKNGVITGAYINCTRSIAGFAAVHAEIMTKLDGEDWQKRFTLVYDSEAGSGFYDLQNSPIYLGENMDVVIRITAMTGTVVAVVAGFHVWNYQ